MAGVREAIANGELLNMAANQRGVSNRRRMTLQGIGSLLNEEFFLLFIVSIFK